MFYPFKSDQHISKSEEEILDFWEKNNTFLDSVKRREGNEAFVFYEGPPTANGRPGSHHVLSRTFKDAICRYQTLKGRYVLRRAGWDTHGLPVELQVEKALGLKNKQDIEEYGIEAFNQKCRESVWQYKEDWEKLTKRMGYWIDLDNAYVTYSSEYIQSVWWGFKQIWDQGRIYQDYKVVPYCSRCGTSLSLAEVAQGYKEVTERSVYIKFKLVDKDNEYILAWTTTPWTLPGNVALAVGENIPYVKIKQDNQIYYVAKERLVVISGQYEILAEFSGSQLVGLPYVSLFDFLNLKAAVDNVTYTVLAADFVNTQDGTGVVHTSVMYGEEDFNLGTLVGLPKQHTVNEQGRFNELVPPWEGIFVKDAEKDIIGYLKNKNLLYKSEQTTHTYPFCWRCDTALIYYARNSWFVRIDDDLRNEIVKNNQTIKWVPEYIKQGRFGNWLEGLRDWSISRERYWGTPMPVWVCEKNREHRGVYESITQLRLQATEESQLKLTDAFDPHRPYIDEIILHCEKCNGLMHRVSEVLDVWFDSGAMPFAQWGYPAKESERFAQQFPADFISEAIDQTRGWFNSLLIISTAIFRQTAYRAVITQSHVLDEHGRKMSKSKGNVVDPWLIMDETGVDALRLYFLSVNQPGDNKNLSLAAVQEVYRKSILIWLNVANFFLTYASLDKWDPSLKSEKTLLDKWAISRVNQAANIIDASLADLDTFNASRELRLVIDELSTWYLRRSRKRRDSAFYGTLHEALLTLALVASPMVPFIAESLYQRLKTKDMLSSVHLLDYPQPAEIDNKLLQNMEQLRVLVTMGHAARSSAGLKLRQPLACAHVVGISQSLSSELCEILADELNVKQVNMAPIPIGWHINEQNGLAIGLDPIISESLREEGIVREIVRTFQALRKQSGCQPGDIVAFSYHTDSPLLKNILERNAEYLGRETSACEIKFGAKRQEEVVGQTENRIDIHPLWVGLRHV